MTEPYYPIEVQELIVRYTEQTVLDGVNFVAAPGEIAVILGGSGCGKSTLLRSILGLVHPVGGSVKLLGQSLSDIDDHELKALRGQIGVLFQNGALFTSMTVGQNVAIVINENMDLPPALVNQIVRMKLSQVGLEEAIDKYPDELSGGMRKRVALARAMATDPKILFCDEPSAGLDPVTSSELDDLLLSLKALYDMTIVVVTHELDSIKRIADHIVMLDKGKVIADGELSAILASSQPIVQEFFGRISRSDDRKQQSLYAMAKGNEK